jgi:hypothetical protein
MSDYQNDERSINTGSRFDRRPVQIPRDWLGHLVQAMGIVGGVVMAIGIPLIIWGTNVNSTNAVLTAQQSKQDRDISDLRNTQNTLTTQLAEMNRAFASSLSTLTAQVGDLADNLKNGRYRSK